MKKLLAILLALTIVGGVAFAQITFSGYERATFKATNTGLTLANRLRLNMSANDADGNFGFSGRIQAEDAAAPVVKYSYGWLTMADKKVKVIAGILGFYDYDIGSGSASDWAATGNVSNDNVYWDLTPGAVIQFLPVEGLSLAVTVESGAGNVGLGNFGLNAKYDITDVGSIVVSSQLADKVADSAASASFSFTGVKGLTAVAGFKYGEGVGYKAANVSGNKNLYGIFTYAEGALGAQLAAEYAIVQTNLYVEGYVDYVIGQFTARALGGYDQNGGNLGNQIWAGAEGYYAVGKAKVMAGFYYGDVKGWTVPFAVKVTL